MDRVVRWAMAVDKLSRQATGGEEGLRGRVDYRPGLDGLRAIAVAAVLIYHLSGTSGRGEFLGGNVFFLISGFLIISILLSEWDTRQNINFRDFYLRRALRLLPALGVALAIGLVTCLSISTIGREPAHTGSE